MTISKRHYLVAALVSLSPGLAGAQQPPTDPAPAPADPAPAEPAPAQGSAAAPAPVEPTPPVEDPIKPEEPKKDEKPAVTAKYDGGTKLSTEDGKFELKLLFRNQIRFESNRNL